MSEETPIAPPPQETRDENHPAEVIGRNLKSLADRLKNATPFTSPERPEADKPKVEFNQHGEIVAEPSEKE